MSQHTATYSPDDNKLRMYPAYRLDKEEYARIKAAGFSWAPKQELFVAPMWTPAREDLLIEWCGDIDDEDTSLVERAEARADRFEEYSEKRLADGKRAHAAVDAICEHIPLGQPILVGHHSEKRARKDAERIENGMRKSIRLFETSTYWVARAAGALHHAKYKEMPAVRARRIKGIEADQRKYQRALAEAEKWLKAWNTPGLPLAVARKMSGHCHLYVGKTVAGHGMTAYDVLRPDEERYSSHPAYTVAQVVDAANQAYPPVIGECGRWIAHLSNRLIYEKAMLNEQGASQLLDAKPRTVHPPLLNYRGQDGKMAVANRYHHGQIDTLQQVDMTAADYAKIHAEYKGTDVVEGSHRIRVAIVRSARVAVFLTDSKMHDKPSSVAVTTKELPRRADPIAHRQPAALSEAEEAAKALRAALKGGVQVAVAPQLFPTPADLAAKVARMADVQPGMEFLEPSAGTGNLVDAVLNIQPGARPVMVEQDHRLVDRLCVKYKTDIGLNRVLQADFLAAIESADLGQFQRIVMNPPFANAADIAHITAAARLLAPGGRLVAICANGPRQQAALKPLASHWEDLPAGSFEASGTMVNAALLVIERAAEPAPVVAPAPPARLLKAQTDLFAAA